MVDGYLVSEVTQQVIDKLNNVKLPKEYHFHIGGESEHQTEAFGGMHKAILIAIVGLIIASTTAT